MRKNLDEIHNLKLDIARAKSESVKELGYQPFGYFLYSPDQVFEDEAFAEELEAVKTFVLEEIIEIMRREAVENPDFFIIKRNVSDDPLSKNSVGLNVYLPKRRDKCNE